MIQKSSVIKYDRSVNFYLNREVTVCVELHVKLNKQNTLINRLNSH